MTRPAPLPGSKTIEGTILAPSGWVRGRIQHEGRITAVEGDPVPAPVKGLPIVLPGFVDLHVHGGGGADIMSGAAALRTAARMHARHGTTSLLATTVSDGPAALARVFDELSPEFRHPGRGGARVLGIHLESPYINPEKLGAQPDTARLGTLEEVRALHAKAPIRVLTLAPELEGHLAFIQGLRTMGIHPQVGHTLASYETAVQAMEAGARSFTHLYNAMTALQHRAPGVVGAALAHAEYAEIIVDLLHVAPGAVRAALRAIPRLYCVTDATAGAGMPDGTYSLGSQTVYKRGAGVRLEDGTLAGSTLTMDDALRNLVSLGVPLAEASRRTSTYPAEYLGLEDRGRVQAGAWADLVVMTADLRLARVLVEGDDVELTDA